MNTIRTTVHDRQVVVTVSDEIPDGTSVEVKIAPVADQIGMDESEWRTGSEAMRDWSDWLETMEPVEFAKPDDFGREFQKFNVQAVREQMFGDGQ